MYMSIHSSIFLHWSIVVGCRKMYTQANAPTYSLDSYEPSHASATRSWFLMHIFRINIRDSHSLQFLWRHRIFYIWLSYSTTAVVPVQWVKPSRWIVSLISQDTVAYDSWVSSGSSWSIFGFTGFFFTINDLTLSQLLVLFIKFYTFANPNLTSELKFR